MVKQLQTLNRARYNDLTVFTAPQDRAARVRAALRAAAERPALPLVRAPFLAAAERWPAVLRRALERA
jgi:hypothetical protein